MTSLDDSGGRCRLVEESRRAAGPAREPSGGRVRTQQVPTSSARPEGIRVPTGESGRSFVPRTLARWIGVEGRSWWPGITSAADRARPSGARDHRAPSRGQRTQETGSAAAGDAGSAAQISCPGQSGGDVPRCLSTSALRSESPAVGDAERVFAQANAGGAASKRGGDRAGHRVREGMHVGHRKLLEGRDFPRGAQGQVVRDHTRRKDIEPGFPI